MNLEPAVAALRAALPDLAVVYLFGSACSGETHPESDIDLAFLAHQLADLETFAAECLRRYAEIGEP